MVNYVERRQKVREGDSKAARRGRKTATNCKKILNRGNELKDFERTNLECY